MALGKRNDSNRWGQKSSLKPEQKYEPLLSNHADSQVMNIHSHIGRDLMDMFHLLLKHCGRRNWWPAETALEVMIGAVLTQNTNWKNVEKAIQNLKKKNLLSFDALHSLSEHELAQDIRPAGYYNIKATRLKNLINLIAEQYRGDIASLLKEETRRLRQRLLTVNGIGPETADSILLYAAGRPVFVIDAYTHRILARHGMIEEQITYQELQELFMENLPEDASLYNEFHALLVEAGKNFCSKKPDCSQCPLNHWGPRPPF